MLYQGQVHTKPRVTFGDYSASALLFMLGFVSLGLTVLMNVSHGSNVALTEDGKIIRQGASIAMDCAGPILFLAAGMMWRKSQRMIAVTVFLAGMSFQAYTVVNLIGFGASERSGAMQYRERVLAAADKQSADGLAVRRETLTWLQKSTVETKGVDSKKALLAEVNSQVDKIASAPVNTPKSMPADAHAATMASLLGVSIDVFMKWEAVIFAGLLGALKMICFTLAPMFWPMKHVVSVRPAGEHGLNDGWAPSDPPKDRTRAPRVIASSATTVASSGASNVVQLPAPESKKDLQRRMIKKFVEECTEPAPGAKISAEELLFAFKKWCNVNSIAMPKVKANGFGRVCGELGLSRKPDGRGMNYINLRVHRMLRAA